MPRALGGFPGGREGTLKKAKTIKLKFIHFILLLSLSILIVFNIFTVFVHMYINVTVFVLLIVYFVIRKKIINLKGRHWKNIGVQYKKRFYFLKKCN